MKNDKTSTPDRQTNSPFARLNRIVDGGHLRGLSRSALAVLIVLVKAQDADGESFYSLDAMARLVGFTRRSVIRALMELVKCGLVENKEDGGGRGHRAVRRIIMQPLKSDSSVTVSDPQTVTAVTINSDSGDHKQGHPCPIPKNIPYLSEQPKEQPKKQTSARGSRRWCDSDVELIWKSYPKKDGKPSGTKAIRKALDRIAKRNTADPVTWLIERVQAYARSVVGTEPHFIKNAQGWFNDDRFDGDFSTPKGSSYAGNKRNKFDGSNGEYAEPLLRL